MAVDDVRHLSEGQVATVFDAFDSACDSIQAEAATIVTARQDGQAILRMTSDARGRIEGSLRARLRSAGINDQMLVSRLSKIILASLG